MRSTTRSRRLASAAIAATSALAVATLPHGPAAAVAERAPVATGARLVSAFGTVPTAIGPRDEPTLTDSKAISNDGRYVVFTSPERGSSDKNDLVDVYLKDLSDQSTELISRDSGGNAVGGRSPSIGPDGRFVAFITAASLVAGDTGGDDVYVFDRRTARTRLGNRASGDPAGIVPLGRSQVSNDGNVVTWAGTDLESVGLRHLDTGVTMTVPSPGANTRGVQLAGDGRHVLTTANGSAWRVDTTTGTYDVVSDFTMTPGISACESSISYDGSRVVLAACAGGLFRWDAANPSARPALTTFATTGLTRWPSLSGDGRYVTYEVLDGELSHWRRIDLVAGTDVALGGGLVPVPADGPNLPAVPEVSGDGMVNAVVSRSTVAGQAETEATRLWAISGATVPGTSTQAWVKGVYQQVLGRVPTGAESSDAVAALASMHTTAPRVIQDVLHTPSFIAPRGPMIRLYQAFFHRVPDNGGYTYWVNRRLAGRTLVTIANQFVASSEFTNAYGSLNNRQFVQLVYENVLGRVGDSGGIGFWTNKLNARTTTRGQVMVSFSESAEHVRVTANQVDFVLGAKAARGTVPTTAQLAAARARWAAGVSITSDLRDQFEVA